MRDSSFQILPFQVRERKVGLYNGHYLGPRPLTLRMEILYILGTLYPVKLSRTDKIYLLPSSRMRQGLL